MEITFSTAQMEGGKLIIDIPYEHRGAVMAFLRGMKKTLYTLHIKVFKKKRSRDANAKMWALIHDMSEILHIPPVEIYRGYIPDVPHNYRIVPVKPEEIPDWDKEWCLGHIGRMTEDMGPCRSEDLKGYHNLKLYRGSSELDTAQFSHLLNLVIQDCQQLGISTLSEREKSLLLENWEKTRCEKTQEQER